MQIRRATLEDARAIAAAFQARIRNWQRMNESGQVEDLPYEALSIYDKWLHGGPWMSLETASIWLSHLVRSESHAWVIEEDGELCAYAEAFTGLEGAPFGRHLHLAHLLAPGGEACADAMMEHILKLAQPAGALTAAAFATDPRTQDLYERYGLEPLVRLHNASLPAQVGQGFYKSTDHPLADPRQIGSWMMPIGRASSAHQEWETLWPSLWDAVPQIMQRGFHRQKLHVSGQDAFLVLQEQLYRPRSADVFCWTAKALSPQLLVAIRDYAHRQGYRTLSFLVDEAHARLLGPGADVAAPHLVTFMRRL